MILYHIFSRMRYYQGNQTAYEGFIILLQLREVMLGYVLLFSWRLMQNIFYIEVLHLHIVYAESGFLSHR